MSEVSMLLHRIEESLRNIDKGIKRIVVLLELRNSIDIGRTEMRQGQFLTCVCDQKGKTSALITCPIHG